MRHTLNSQKGVSIYVAVLITVVLLGIALGLSTTFLMQIKTLRGVGRSVLAFYAADAGTERVLFIEANMCATEEKIKKRVKCIQEVIDGLSSGDMQLPNGARYELTIERAVGGACPEGSNYCSSSIGIYKEARRAIRITR